MIRADKIASELKAYIESNIDDCILMKHAADHFHVSREYLSRLFRERYGLAPNAYRMKLKRERVMSYHNKGYCVMKISEKCSTHKSTVGRIIRDHVDMDIRDYRRLQG